MRDITHPLIEGLPPAITSHNHVRKTRHWLVDLVEAVTIARLAEDFIGFGRFQRCLLIIAGLGFMADAIEVGAAHGKGGKGEEPGLITSAQEVPLGPWHSFELFADSRF